MARRNDQDARVNAAAIKALLNAPFRFETWAALSAPHLHVRIGNAPPAIDQAAALADLELFMSRIDRFGCRYCEICQIREAIFAETDLQFRDAMRVERVIPCTIVVRVTGGLIQDIRFHLDPSPIPKTPSNT